MRERKGFEPEDGDRKDTGAVKEGVPAEAELP